MAASRTVIRTESCSNCRSPFPGLCVQGDPRVGRPGQSSPGRSVTHAAQLDRWPKNSVPAGSSSDRSHALLLLLLRKALTTHWPPDFAVSAGAGAVVRVCGLPAAVRPLVPVGVQDPAHSRRVVPECHRWRWRWRWRWPHAHALAPASPALQRPLPGVPLGLERVPAAACPNGSAPPVAVPPAVTDGDRPPGRAPAERLGHRHPRRAPQLAALAVVVVGRLRPGHLAHPGRDQDGPLPRLRHSVVGGVELARTRRCSPSCGVPRRTPATAAGRRGPARARPTQAARRG